MAGDVGGEIFDNDVFVKLFPQSIRRPPVEVAGGTAVWEDDDQRQPFNMADQIRSVDPGGVIVAQTMELQQHGEWTGPSVRHNDAVRYLLAKRLTPKLDGCIGHGRPVPLLSLPWPHPCR